METRPDLLRGTFTIRAAGMKVLVMFVPDRCWVVYAGVEQVGSFIEDDGTEHDPWPSYRPRRGDVEFPAVDDWRCAVEHLVREHTGQER